MLCAPVVGERERDALVNEEIENGTGDWQNIQPIIRETMKLLFQALSHQTITAKEEASRAAEQIDALTKQVNVLKAKVDVAIEASAQTNHQSAENITARIEAVEARVGAMRELLSSKAEMDSVNECLLLKANKSDAQQLQLKLHSMQEAVAKDADVKHDAVSKITDELKAQHEQLSSLQKVVAAKADHESVARALHLKCNKQTYKTAMQELRLQIGRQQQNIISLQWNRPGQGLRQAQRKVGVLDEVDYGSSSGTDGERKERGSGRGSSSSSSSSQNPLQDATQQGLEMRLAWLREEQRRQGEQLNVVQESQAQLQVEQTGVTAPGWLGSSFLFIDSHAHV